jgi:hypothetical protein
MFKLTRLARPGGYGLPIQDVVPIETEIMSQAVSI